MPTLEINGHRVQVGPQFDSLTPEQQQQTVNEIAAQIHAETANMGPQQPNIGRKGDMIPGDVVQSDISGKVAQGATLGGIDEAAAAINATTGSNALGAGNLPTWGERYAQNKARLDAEYAATEAGHPVGSVVAEMAGGLALPGSAGARLAVKAPTLLGKVARGALTGAGYGGVYGFNTGNGLEDRVQRAQQGVEAGAALGGAFPVVGAGLGAGYRAVTNALGGPQAAERLTQFTQAGVRPTAGAVTGSRPVQMVEQALTNTPFSAGRMQNVHEVMGDELAAAKDRMIDQIGTPRTQQGAGEVIKDAAQAATQRFEERQKQLYDQAYSLIGTGRPTSTPNTSRLLFQMVGERAAAGGTRDDVLVPIMERANKIATAAANGGLPFDAIRALRTDIGRMTKAAPQGMSESAQMDKLRALYGALTKDIQTAAAQAGPAAARALKVADRYTRFHLTVNQPLWQKLANTQADEKAFQFALEGSGKGGSRLWALRKNFTSDEWDTVAATVLDRLGEATPGARGATELGGVANDFSAASFITNWNKLAPEAKMALFSGRRYTDLRKSLDNLTKVMGAVKDAQRMANPPGTARQLITLGQGAAAATAIATGNLPAAAAIVAGPWMTARMITAPWFIRMLTGFAKSGKAGPEAIQRFATNLGFVAATEPDMKDEILQLQRHLLANKSFPASAPQVPVMQGAY